jgi:hypothetical protein
VEESPPAYRLTNEVDYFRAADRRKMPRPVNTRAFIRVEAVQRTVRQFLLVDEAPDLSVEI